MSNVTNKSLREAGVPEALWPRAKKICNSPPYKTKREPYRASGGPFDFFTCRHFLFLEDGKTGPIKVGDWHGQYNRQAPAVFRSGSWEPGTVGWVNLP